MTLIPSAPPPGCYAQGNVPNGSTTMTGLQMDQGVWQIHEGADPDGNTKYYLVNAGTMDWSGSNWSINSGPAYEGVYEDGSYTFDGKTTSVAKDNPTTPTYTITQEDQNTLTLTPDGDAMTGTWKMHFVVRCETTSTQPICANYATQYPECAIEHQLRGSRIDAQNIFPVNQ